MLKMALCTDNERVIKICNKYNVEYFDNLQIYVVTDLKKEKAVGYAFFTIADYEIEILKIVYDKSDVLLFDFIIKGVLGYGEQCLSLYANFKNIEDELLLIKFGFVKSDKNFKVKLYETLSNCKDCKK